MSFSLNIAKSFVEVKHSITIAISCKLWAIFPCTHTPYDQHLIVVSESISHLYIIT